MNFEEFTQLIDETLGQTMLLEIKNNKVYTAFDKEQVEKLYVKLILPVVVKPVKEKKKQTL